VKEVNNKSFIRENVSSLVIRCEGISKHY